MDFKKIEDKWQKRWEKEKTFQANPSKQQKFFMTIPYPYISGSLHIGHARVVTEADVFVRFQRMTGKNTLYPIAFHISGTPVLGISLAIKNNDQKQIELYKGYVRAYVKDEKEVERTVKSFENPEKIVEFFIPKMKDEFKTLGLSVDWRRSYTSGDPEHQALVEWQFRKYKEKDYLLQGKYPILFSKTLNNAVGEDDIKEGDTNPVDMQEFTLIKFKFGDSYLVAATLRPETMYGQTNMWVNPDTEYAKANVNGENWIISRECAEKLQYQEKKVKILGTINGKEMIGKKCFAPFVEREIIILPSSHCNPKIGTGLVTSVPSDAPFDYMALKELQDSKELAQKYRLDHDEIKNIRLIPIIKLKGYGEMPAVEICKKLGITKSAQSDKLTEATQEIYKLEFHTGIMNQNCGPYAGMTVAQAKEKMRKALIDKKLGDKLYETSRQALSRDGGEVIVAVLDGQWFLDFNAKGWKDKARQCLKQTELWPEKYRKQFEDVFNWLDKRPCARKRGLGTRLPFDQNWVIESLSDSTIYMTLYPIIHLIRQNKIKKEQLTSEFFEYVMKGEGETKEVSKKTGIPAKTLNEMNKEWNYWYPFDQRHTFTAHLSNHLSFMIFAHAAIFDRKHWPKRISFHGMIISEGEKMSKSKGNVITLMDINKSYGADAFRAFMCNSTSVESTFNWQSEKVQTMNRHLAMLYETIRDMQQNKKPTSSYKKYASYVSKTEKAVQRATSALETMNLRDYSNIVLYEMLNNYKHVSKKASKEDLKSINSYIANKWTAMLAPLVPHMAEELWSTNNKKLVSVGEWPKADKKQINDRAEFEEQTADSMFADIKTVLQLAKIEEPNKITLVISEKWKYGFIKKLKQELEKTRNIGKLIKSLMDKTHGQEISRLVPALAKNPARMPLIVLDQETELKVFKQSKEEIAIEFGCKVEIVPAEGSKDMKAKQAMPGKPAIIVA